MSMSILQIALVAGACALLLAWWWLRRRSAEAAVPAADRIDTLTGWPPQATRVLSTRERIAFGTLVRALPEYMVLAQVPLARFLDVPKRNSYSDWLRRLGYQCVDFAVCDMAAQVIAVVELQPVGGPQSERARKRLARMARSLKAARIPLLVWPETPLPSPEVARDAILPKPKPAPAQAGAPQDPIAAATENDDESAAKPAPTAPDKVSPFDEAGRDSTFDETIELEPPPSTWYDDLDSGPAPLRKR